MNKKIPVAQAIASLAASKHAIAKADADKWAKRYQKFIKALANAVAEGAPAPAITPEMGQVFSFNKKGVQKILKESGAVGLRIYPGINDDKKLTMILVAFDAAGNNITYTEMPVAAKSKTGKPLKNQPPEKSDDGLLDDAQVCPPYPAPSLP